MGEARYQAELRHEQTYLDGLYRRLDELRVEAADALIRIRRSHTAGTPAALTERDAFHALHSERVAQLNAVEEQLCFGRLDLTDGSRRYVGRIGMRDELGDRALLDWRAPGAAAFYQATAATPDGVLRRRHLTTSGRTVTGIEDEVLDLDGFAASNGEADSVAGEGALLLALNATRTGQMHDIVMTIQAEQDQVIRAPLPGVLVVQGGPGTGKTAVALHRAAYLLYAHRDRIARAGVLIVGPNRRFLRYIEQVLPALGETGVVMATPGQLYPGVEATAAEDPDSSVVKGNLRMVKVLANAVRLRQRIPSESRQIKVDGTTIVLTPSDVATARGRARSSRKQHNVARLMFVAELLARLAGKLATAQGASLDESNRHELVELLRESPDARREINLGWMPLVPERLLADLFATPTELARAGTRLSTDEQKLLLRKRDSAWTAADVPLLDELAELVGEDDTPVRRAAEQRTRDRAAELDYARAVLRQTGSAGVVNADVLVDRYAESAAVRRAHEDRGWVYGHVVVDEAQELSAMQWRMLMRRCPSKSMTVVGDTAQTGTPAGARSWGQMLDQYVAGRWQQRELTVNYRTPGVIMAVAAKVLAEAGISSITPVSARQGLVAPTAERVRRGDLDPVLSCIRRELADLAVGQLAVIGPPGPCRTLAELLANDGERIMRDTSRPEALADVVSILTPREAKGLEFDVVVLLEPAEIVAASAHGTNDLYVAMTRPTQRLRVLHSLPLPAGLTQLETAG